MSSEATDLDTDMDADPSGVTNVSTLTGDPIVNEARDRWDRCVEWENTSRQRMIDDLKFRHGDSDNGYQWPNRVRTVRENDNRPCLTMNVIRQHNLMIVNEAKQNKSAVKIVGTGNGATQEAANVFRGIIRHIEYISDAQAAYSTALEYQVDGGLGWFRLVTDYADDDSFDQEIFIRRVWDPLSVYLDPDIHEKDGSDAQFGFVFDQMPNKAFKSAYPEYAYLAGTSPLGIPTGGRDATDETRICEYFRVTYKKDTLWSFMDQGARKVLREGRMSPAILRAIKADKMSRSRDVFDPSVEWKLIVGATIVDETIWPGKYIPLIRVLGEETVIDGLLDRKGHTRAMKDAQRLYNFNASAQTEFVALQSKTPYVAAASAIEEYEGYWNTANTVNHSVLPYNAVDDEGNKLEAPKRQDPPVQSTAYESGMATAFNQMMMTSGQWQNQMGMLGNERTGKAINARQRQSDTSVFHFQDNFAAALRYLGKQLLDLIPKVYDTKRVVQILADDGTDQAVQIDPAAKKAYEEQKAEDGEVTLRIFNPTVGKYDVAADVGPAYGTKREETVDALTLILTQNPNLTAVVGDLLLSAMDFDKAQEAAQRLKRMVPPQALGTGPTQTEQELQQKLEQTAAALEKALGTIAKDQIKLVGKAEARDIDVYEAETKRFAALKDAIALNPGGLLAVVQQLDDDALKTSLMGILASNATQVQQDEQDQGGNTPDAAAPVAPAPPRPNAPVGAMA